MARSSSTNGRQGPPPTVDERVEYEAPYTLGRDVAGSRGRVPVSGKVSMSNIHTAGLQSPRSQSSATVNRSPIVNGQLGRRPSQGYNHAWQASKSQHQSRNGVFTSSPTTSSTGSDSATVFVEHHRGAADYSANVRRGLSQKQPSKSPSGTSYASSPHALTTSLAISEREAIDLGVDGAHKRSDNSSSSRHRLENSHHRATSHKKGEPKAVGEYAMHQLFNQFILQSDHKIKQCLMEGANWGEAIELICGPGVDDSFDKLIKSMVFITRRNLRPLLDSVMVWRKERSRSERDTASPTSPHRGQSRRPTVSSQTQSIDFHQRESPGNSDPIILYRSAAIVYIVCRVLTEAFTNAQPESVDSQTYGKLEAIIFEQIRLINPNHFHDQPYNKALWTIYTQVLGTMSSFSLATVTACFTHQLSSLQRDLYGNGRTVPPRDMEYKVEIMIRSSKHFHLRTQPEGLWRESCHFLFAMADLFLKAHGAILKYAYCSILTDLLLPAASNWATHLNTLRFREFLTIINPRVSGMVAKPRHWADAISLSSVLLCASPTEQFASSWLSSVGNLQTKLKDRSTRAFALQAITRLVWTYLERIKEAGTAIRRLDDIMKAVLPPTKKTSFSIDAGACEPLVELIRIIGFHYQEYCFSKIVFPLINFDLFATGKDIKVDQLDPERMVIGIRAFLLIMADLEAADGGKPPFPCFGSGGWAMDPNSHLVLSPGENHSFSSLTHSTDAPDRASLRPVAMNKLNPSANEYYSRFCEVLGKIIITCNNAFGGQAVLDEKFGGTFTPKTPLADTFTFGRRTDDHQGATEQRLGIYELLQVAVQALPRCLPAKLQLKPLINLLCTCTAHVQSNIADSSIRSLKAIAEQSFAQAVTIGFARFIFNFDARYSTMSEEGLMGPEHIEHTLSLYVELLQIWIEEIKQKTKEAANGVAKESLSGSRGLQLDLISVSNHVDEVESHGVFFLCSQSRRVRAFAVKVLRIVTEFDSALGRANPRIIQILEGDSQRVMDMNDDSLTVAERSRLQKGKSKNITQPTLVELSSSDESYDITLWLKVFPNIIRLSFELCPSAVMLGREIVCARLLQIHETINFLNDDVRPPVPYHDGAPSRAPHRLQSTSPQIIIEQWKLYLIMACTTVTNAGAQTQSQLDKTQHVRKISKPAPKGQDKISSARALFAFVIPLLDSTSSSIREAIVIALSSIHINLFRTLLDSLQYAVTACKEEAKTRIGSHQRTGSNPKKDPRKDRMRAEVTQIYRLTARFLQEQAVLQDEWILVNLSTYARDLMIFLGDAEIQSDWDCQKLRRQFCGLLEELYLGLDRTKDALRFMPFESRRSAFTLMEDWCGYSPNQAKIVQREDSMRRMVMERHPDSRDRTKIAASIETEKRDLSTAALGAMAALCAGPVSVRTEGGEMLSFDTNRMLAWIDQIFSTQLAKVHTIGRRALHNLIIHNRGVSYLLEWCLEQCYAQDRLSALQSYFDVASRVLSQYEDYPLPFWRILAALLFLLGNGKREIRMQSAKLLQSLEQRRQQDSKIKDFDISISDRTTAVHKSASFEISRRLSKQHKDTAFFIFSQFSLHFRNIRPDNQRQMVYAILPWIQMIELQIERGGEPTAQSYMLLANLLEITTKTSGVLHNEVQALWKALATGHPGNVQLVLDFVISLCLSRGDQAFVSYAKQIIVYMAGDIAGPKVIEFLLLQITPKNLVRSLHEPAAGPVNEIGLPYVADLSEALPIVNRQDSFSLSQLAMVFLVDLIVAPMTIKVESVPLILQVVLILWDDQIALVQEQAREMLVHLIHELVITKVPQEKFVEYAAKKHAVEEFVDSVRHHAPSVVWQYRDLSGREDESSVRETLSDDRRVPLSMPKVTSQVIEIFELVYPTIQDHLARLSLLWGTLCPVKHAACRSLQIFRCVLVPLDEEMLENILARISNTLSHEGSDVQVFSIEMLTTIESIIDALEPADLLKYPHLYWTIYACLGTVYEPEFIASIGMLDKMLPKLNFDDPAVVKLIKNARPAGWQGAFEGLTPLVYKGLKSELSLNHSLRALNTLATLPEVDLVGIHTRLPFTILANLPTFLQSFENASMMSECFRTAQILAGVAEAQGKPQISRILKGFTQQIYVTSANFLSQILSILRQEYCPTWELKILVFVIGLLSNNLAWYKMQALEVVRVLIREVDTRRSEISDCGPDLISPILRLLQTDLRPQAILILDNVAAMSETPLSNQHIRMSMAAPGQRRGESANIQSLYGVPEETGWSQPMPAHNSEVTRANMHLVYQAFHHLTMPVTKALPTPEIEFHPEDDPEASYFSLDRSDTLGIQDLVADVPVEGGMGDLLTKLNSLDDFFAETLDVDNDVSNRYSAITAVPYNLDPVAGAEVYEQETAPILERTLARTASTTSLHNQVAERSYPPVMTPTAFNPSAQSIINAPPRPSLHSRSVTSPANNITKKARQMTELLSDDEHEDGTFSEDERSTGHVAANESRLLGSTSLKRGNSTFRTIAPGLEGKDYKQRGLLRAQSRSNGHSPGSPSVPKVPEAYLQHF